VLLSVFDAPGRFLVASASQWFVPLFGLFRLSSRTEGAFTQFVLHIDSPSIGTVLDRLFNCFIYPRRTA
jgi:hypothetical protein